jgi:hypothetical protein
MLHDAWSNESTWEGYLALLRKADVDTKCWLGVTWEASKWYKIKIDICACDDKNVKRIEIMEILLGRDTRSSAAVYIAEKPAASITGQCTLLNREFRLKRLFTFTRLHGITTQNTVTFTATATARGVY